MAMSPYTDVRYRSAQRLANKVTPYRDQEEDTGVDNPLDSAITAQPIKRRIPARTIASDVPKITAYQGNAAVDEGNGGNASGKPWEAPGSSMYAARVGTDRNGNYLSEHGRVRRLGTEKELADATAYRDEFWKNNPTGFQKNVGPQSNEEYKASWDTDNYAKPGYIANSYGGVLAGYDAGNWEDPNMQTPKYVVGRILSNYPPTIEGLGQAMDEISQAYPGTEFDGKDKITIPGVGTIDVLANAGGENQSWWWGAQDGGQATQTPLETAIASPETSMTADQDIFSQYMLDPTWRELLTKLGIQV